MRLIGNFDDRSIYSTESINHGNDASLQNLSTITAEFWVKVKDYGQLNYLIRKYGTADGNVWKGFFVAVETDGRLYAGYRNTSTGSVIQYGNIVPKGEWIYIALSIGITGESKLYVNSKLEFTFGNGGMAPNNVNTLSILPVASKGVFMTDVRLWNYVRNPEQIAANKDTHIDQAEGLVLSVRGVNLTSTQAIDMSGYNNHGTLVGSPVQSKDSPFNKVLTTGEGVNKKLLLSTPKTPYAVKLDGTSNSYVAFKNTKGQYNRGTPFSYSFWFKANTTGPQETIISNAIFASSQRNGFYLQRLSTGRLQLQIGTASGGAWVTGGANSSILTHGVYHHIVLVFTGTGFRLYVNGVLDFSISTVESGYGFERSTELTIGGQRLSNGTAVFPLNGEVHKVRNFNVALTEEEAMADRWDKPHPAMTNELIFNQAYPYDREGQEVGYLGSTAKIVESTAPIGQRSAMKFDGLLSYIKLNKPGEYNSLAEFTIDFWAQVNGFNRWFFDDGKLDLSVTQEGFLRLGNGGAFSTSTVKKEDNVWHHFAVRVLSTGVAHFLYDGVQIVLRGGWVPVGDFISLGVRSPYSPTGYCPGKIQGFRIRRGALTDAQINATKYIIPNANDIDLVEYFPLTEGIGTSVYGIKGTTGTVTPGNTGGWQPPTTANWVNKCARFTAGGQMLKSTRRVILKGEFTISLLMYRRERSTDYQFFISNDDVVSSNLNAKIGFREVAGNSLAIRLNNSGFLHQREIGFTDAMFNTWVNLVIIRDKDNLITTILNNTIVTNWTTPMPEEANFNIIGGDTVVTSGYRQRFIGSLDEIRVWNIAKAIQDVQTDSQRVLDRHPNLVGYWRLDGNGWDSSGHGNHLVPVGYAKEADAFVESDSPMNYLAPINDVVIPSTSGGGQEPDPDPQGYTYLYEEDFEDGTMYTNWIKQSGGHPWNLQLVDNPRGSGKVSRFELRDTDTMNNNGTRTEVLLPDRLQEAWYAASIYFPSDGNADETGTSRESVFQWHQGGGSGSPYCMLLVQEGEFRMFLNNDAGIDIREWLGVQTKDVWHDFIFHTRFSTGADGFVKVYWNNQLVFSNSGPNMNSAFSLPEWKLGIYKWDWNNEGTTTTTKRSMYVDNVRVGGSNATLDNMKLITN